MPTYRFVSHFLAGLTCLVSLSSAGAEPGSRTAAMIEELELRAAPEPLSSNPAWKPKRVVVSLSPSFSSRLPEFEQQLLAAAGGVELVIDRAESFALGRDVLSGADAIISLCTAATLDNADESLLWVHNYYAGMETCTDPSETQLQNTLFSNSKRLASATIAEHAIAMLLTLTNGLPGFVRAQEHRQWQPNLAGANRWGNIKGKTILVVGLGGIGGQIAWRAHGLGMRVIATRNSSRDGPQYVEYVGLPDELLKLVGEADVIVNALPLTASTTGLFDKTLFNRARAGAIFLSVGRGKSTETEDLIAALESGQLWAAGLDVTDPEPLPPKSPLWQMSNVIITPHISGISADSFRDTAALAVENLRRYVAGEALLNVVDMRAGY